MTAATLAITVVGAGVVGTSLARRFAELGHRVSFGARDLGSAKVSAALEAIPGARAVPLPMASDGADLVVLAVPYDAVVPTLEALGELTGTVLVDPTNAIRHVLPDGCASVPDLIRRERPDATVVKAFNTIGAEAFLDPVIDGRPAFLPVAGPARAVEVVRDLAADMGFDAVVLGDLDVAPVLEHHARLWMHLAFRTGLGRGLGFGLLRARGVGDV